MTFEDQHGLSGPAVRAINTTHQGPAATYDMTRASGNVIKAIEISEADQIKMADGHGIAPGVAPVLSEHFKTVHAREKAKANLLTKAL